MKKFLLIALIMYADFSQAANLSAYFSYSTFDVPGSGSYIETYLNVIGNTVKFIPSENNKLKGEIQVQWIIRNGDKIVHFDKYNLQSPVISANDSLIPDFVDLQRVNLQAGSYTVELSIHDINSENKETTLKQDISIGFPSDTLSLSDIELAESYTKTNEVDKFSKSGFEIVPQVNPFYPKEVTNLRFYAELYRTDISPAEDFLVRYFISRNDNNQLLDKYTSSYKQSPKKTTVIMGDFMIADLGSGNFNLAIEIINKKNKVIAYKQTFFQRSNLRNKPAVTADINGIDITNTFISPVTNADTLADYIACLYPISSSLESEIGDNQIEIKNAKSMQQYIYYFWSSRSSSDPEKAWNDYRQEVFKANASFPTLNKKGYETDRGRVYLQYGAPNTISAENQDPNAYPYEIWQYYKILGQSNRKFVFVARERASNEYRLMHSDAKGEISDPQWELHLHDRTQQFGSDYDQNNSIDTYGSDTKGNFKNPH